MIVGNNQRQLNAENSAEMSPEQHTQYLALSLSAGLSMSLHRQAKDQNQLSLVSAGCLDNTLTVEPDVLQLGKLS